MKSYFKITMVLIGLISVTVTSCRKGSTAADDSISAQDANNVSKSMEAGADDAAAAAGQVGSYKELNGGGNIALNNPNHNFLAGANITDTSSNGIVITYDGTTEWNGFTRSGTITITHTAGTSWQTAGAVLNINYSNVKITDVQTGNAYTFNGTHIVTNVSGGLAWKVMAGLAAGTTVTHNIHADNMSITFPNGAVRTWTVNRSRSWTSSADNHTFTVGVSSIDGTNNVTETGTNRFGDQFTNSITSPIMANNNCAYRPYTGEFHHQLASRMSTVLFGTDPSGVQQNSATNCGSFGTYGYYITYTNSNATRHRFVSYWR